MFQQYAMARTQRVLTTTCLLLLGMLCLLGVAVAGTASSPAAHGKPAVEAAPEEEEKSPKEEFVEKMEAANCVLVILSVLIPMSILFEVMKDRADHRTSALLKPIIHQLWSELTVLGFLSLVSFLTVKSGVLQEISVKLFDEPEELVEIVENVHMMLFAVMIVFVSFAQTVLQTRLARVNHSCVLVHTHALRPPCCSSAVRMFVLRR
jgi:hypothetical protein